MSRKCALNFTRARAWDSKGNATIAEKLDIQSASAPRPNQMQRESGAREHIQEPGAREDSKERARESGKQMEMKHKETSTATSKRRTNRARRRTSWIQMGTKSSK